MANPAYEQGANDFLRGQHFNPFHNVSQPQQFTEWARGYIDCRNNTADMADLLLPREVL